MAEKSNSRRFRAMARFRDRDIWDVTVDELGLETFLVQLSAAAQDGTIIAVSIADVEAAAALQRQEAVG